MKLAIDEVPGVAQRRGPNLLAGPLVPGQYGNLSWGVTDPIGMERGSRRQLLIRLGRGNGRGIAPSDHAVRSNRPGYRHSHRATAFDCMSFTEEDQESFFSEERFQTGSAHRVPIVILDDRGPVGTLGQPDRLR